MALFQKLCSADTLYFIIFYEEFCRSRHVVRDNEWKSFYLLTENVAISEVAAQHLLHEENSNDKDDDDDDDDDNDDDSSSSDDDSWPKVVVMTCIAF